MKKPLNLINNSKSKNLVIGNIYYTLYNKYEAYIESFYSKLTKKTIKIYNKEVMKKNFFKDLLYKKNNPNKSSEEAENLLKYLIYLEIKKAKKKNLQNYEKNAIKFAKIVLMRSAYGGKLYSLNIALQPMFEKINFFQGHDKYILRKKFLESLLTYLMKTCSFFMILQLCNVISRVYAKYKFPIRIFNIGTQGFDILMHYISKKKNPAIISNFEKKKKKAQNTITIYDPYKKIYNKQKTINSLSANLLQNIDAAIVHKFISKLSFEFFNHNYSEQKKTNLTFIFVHDSFGWSCTETYNLMFLDMYQNINLEIFKSFGLSAGSCFLKKNKGENHDRYLQFRGEKKNVTLLELYIDDFLADLKVKTLTLKNPSEKIKAKAELKLLEKKVKKILRAQFAAKDYSKINFEKLRKATFLKPI